MGLIGLFVKSKNVSSIRVIRMLRPLRTVNSLPGMRRLVASLIYSFPTLLDVLGLFVFFMIVFGVIAC